MISCDEFMNAFGDYLEGDIASEVRHQLDSHLSHCRTCQVIYDSSRKTLKILTESGSFDLPEAPQSRSGTKSWPGYAMRRRAEESAHRVSISCQATRLAPRSRQGSAGPCKLPPLRVTYRLFFH